MWLILFFSLPIGYALLLALVPRGNPFYEALWLPALWFRLLTAPKSGMTERRLTYGDHSRQYLLSLRPQNGKTAPLTVVYFHGGGWRIGAPEHFRANARVLTGQGYHVLLPSYRRLPHHDYGDIRKDLEAIRRLILEILREEGLEQNGLVIGGMSAGGHLTAMLALDPDLRQPDLPLRGLFFLGAPLDLREMPDSRTIRQLAGPRGSTAFQRANPIAFIPADFTVPALFIHGEKDGMVPLPASLSFVDQLRAKAGARVSFHLIAGGTHLDVVRWSYADGDQRRLLLDWLRKREAGNGGGQ